MDLTTCDDGAAVRVVQVDLDSPYRRRFAELGLAPGAVVHVTHRAAFGGRVVGVGADRLAIDAATCARIVVTPLARVAS